jgi:hypothetical protein
VFRTQEEPNESKKLVDIADPKMRNEKAVELVISSFKKLLEQSKVLEDEIILTRSQVNDIHLSNAQADMQTDVLAMSVACNELVDEKIDARIKLNLNNSGASAPKIGDCLLFIRGKDENLHAFGFNRVELDARALQDLSERESETPVSALVGRVERLKTAAQTSTVYVEILQTYN